VEMVTQPERRKARIAADTLEHAVASRAREIQTTRCLGNKQTTVTAPIANNPRDFTPYWLSDADLAL
jgi:hypothetical protein